MRLLGCYGFVELWDGLPRWTLHDLRRIAPSVQPPSVVQMDGYWITKDQIRGFDCLLISGTNDRGILYGAFSLLSKMARGESIL